MYRLRIVHLDICLENVLYAFPEQVATNSRLLENNVFFIHFHTSRQLALGPGLQPPILLPYSQEEKPSGVAMLDSYSFDVYCAGRLTQFFLKVDDRCMLPLLIFPKYWKPRSPFPFDFAKPGGPRLPVFPLGISLEAHIHYLRYTSVAVP
ncbi:hypothetical protein V8D89_005166 [Ganoderma adspersum]